MSRAVGIVGYGTLGSAVARTLAESGCAVSAWNRTDRPAPQDGVTVCDGVAELVDASELILVTVTTYAAAHEVLDGIGSLAQRTVAVVSTGVAGDAQRMAATVAQRGGGYLDVALLGYPADLGQASTVLAVAGPRELWLRHAEIFQALGGAAPLTPRGHR